MSRLRRYLDDLYRHRPLAYVTALVFTLDAVLVTALFITEAFA